MQESLKLFIKLAFWFFFFFGVDKVIFIKKYI